MKKYTHEYKARSGKWIKCYIDWTSKYFNVRVTNENGVGVLLKCWNLRKIKSII